MSIETWLAFVATSAVLLVIPGPAALLVASCAISQGWRVAAPMAAGVALGDLVAMTLSRLGMGALLAASATRFTVVKWLGATWLIWLGVKLWLAGRELRVTARTDAAAPGHLFAHTWLVTTLIPKNLSFFVAFLSQFLGPARPLASQMVAFTATFATLAFANAFACALLGARAGRLAARLSALAWARRVGGAALIATGAAAALTRRAARC